jgi:hypothetical protein
MKALLCFIYIYYTGSFIPMKKSECITTEKSYIIEVYFVFQTHLKHAALRRKKKKDWLAQNEDKVCTISMFVYLLII